MENDIIIEQQASTIGTKTINIGTGGGSDVEAGIQFIYHMREHLVDIGIATVYAIAIYAVVLFLKRKFTHCKCSHCGCDKDCR